MAYEFHYTPTGTGVISGKEVLEQTEDAINDLGNTAISGVQEALDKAEQALTNSENAVDDAQTALNTANNAEGVAIQAQTDVGNLSGTVTNIGNRVTTAEGNISNLQGRMTTAEGNVTNLQGRMTTAEGNIGNLQTAVSTAQATANSAQQTATTARQQSYVFRYSSTALTPSSTNSNALLDNTDNLKVGDKVIDSSGVLFSITAIDTANSTFTIGTALIDLAQDSDVVHKSGNETVGGQKTFSDDLLIYNSDNSVDTPRLNIKTSKYVRGDTTNTDTMRINFIDSNGNNVASVYAYKNTGGSQYLSFQVYTIDNNNANITSTINYYISKNGDKYFLPYEDNQIILGSTVRRWKSTYAIKYYYGSNNVEFSTKFVTTDTAQTITGVKTFASSPVIYNSDTTGSVPQLTFKNSKTAKGSTTETGAQLIYFADKNNAPLSMIESRVVSNGCTTLSTVAYNFNDSQNVSSSVHLIKNPTTAYYAPGEDNDISLGRASARWLGVYATNYYYGSDNVEFSNKFVTTDTAQTISGNKTFSSINGVEPSALSLPATRDNAIDISSYFTNFNNGDSNQYTPTVNGWVYLETTGCNALHCFCTTTNNLVNYGNTVSRANDGMAYVTFPVLANTLFKCTWYSNTTITLSRAWFIPCQGNV